MNKCVAECPDKTYKIDKKCYNCANGDENKYTDCSTCVQKGICSKCISDIQLCDICIPSYFLYKGKCFTECPRKTKQAENQNCVDCIEDVDSQN